MSTCHFDGPDADCYARKDVTTIIYCVVCAAVGILICGAGFRMLQVILCFIEELFWKTFGKIL